MESGPINLNLTTSEIASIIHVLEEQVDMIKNDVSNLRNTGDIKYDWFCKTCESVTGSYELIIDKLKFGIKEFGHYDNN